MQELAATGADGIRMMAGMLVPAAEGKNAPWNTPSTGW